ncbi:hypothetical protein M422DRAFT_267177 [Sphaerobolus stellatus SS14]|uniref:Uncharacterized protein n=1 Tax=Sphaerobolus stellatus (strain SS14) TaxID=990650 RepID=A0A0C9UQ86_SPHS4|nr:hypothetical protein M422DRAFT_267177 [Sphaerobolus stellatus SS14]
MEKLKPTGEDGNHGRGVFRELTKDDLIMISSWMEEHRMWRDKGEVAEAEAAKTGKGKRELSWIWKIQFGTTEPDRDKLSEAVDEWTTEVIRIEWLHAEASVSRFEEEMKQLEAESERVGKTFRYYQRKWLLAVLTTHKEALRIMEAGGEIPRSMAGAMAYGRRQAIAFERLAITEESRFADLQIEKVKLNI